MLKVALTGPTGLVGSRIIELLHNDFIFIPLPHDALDITNKDRVYTFLKNLDFDMILHLAAYTLVDKAEEEPEKSRLINVEGTRNLFDFCISKQKKFIYTSTDFVFDGEHPPYFEDSIPNPLGVYAKTKYEGECIVKDKAMIIRFSYPYRTAYDKKKDFVRSLKFLLESHTPLTMIQDTLITPTFIDDIAQALRHLFVNFTPEIFHIIGASSISPYNAAIMISHQFHLDSSLIIPITLEEYSKGKAPRPRYSVTKSKKNTFYPMKSFNEGLKLIK
ncbi:MAG: sugar nucleotide-binding protein [bacterium]|nr:sugar nucleotide-binding protein [bacterium]